MRIFLSHSHKDNDWCSAFVDELKRYVSDVWYDKQGLYVGDSFIEKIEKELEERDTFLVVLTPDSWASQWVRKEIQLALTLHKRMIGVLHKPTQPTGFITTYQMLKVIGLSSAEAAKVVAAELRVAHTEQHAAGAWVQSAKEQYEYFEITGDRSFFGLFSYQITNVETGQVFYKRLWWYEPITSTPDKTNKSNQKSIEELRQFAHINRLEELPEKGPEWYSYRFRRKKN